MGRADTPTRPRERGAAALMGEHIAQGRDAVLDALATTDAAGQG